MFAKLLFAAVALLALLVRADPNPIVPGEYMRSVSLTNQVRNLTYLFGSDVQALVILTRREETA